MPFGTGHVWVPLAMGHLGALDGLDFCGQVWSRGNIVSTAPASMLWAPLLTASLEHPHHHPLDLCSTSWDEMAVWGRLRAGGDHGHPGVTA